MYKDREAQKQAQRENQKRYRNRQKGITQGITFSGDTVIPDQQNVIPSVIPTLADITGITPSDRGIYAWLKNPDRRNRLRRICETLKPGLRGEVTLGPWGPDMNQITEMLATLDSYGVK